MVGSNYLVSEQETYKKHKKPTLARVEFKFPHSPHGGFNYECSQAGRGPALPYPSNWLFVKFLLVVLS